MILDVSQLIQNDGAVKELDFVYNMDNVSFNGLDIVFETPFELKGVVKNIAGILELNLDADVSFKTQCARCLDDVKVQLSFEVREVFSKTEPDNSDEDIIVLDSGNIDLGEVIERAFIGALPISYLCSEECKGLCNVCGCNLNKDSCTCEYDNTDPRLAALKQFLKD